MKGLRCWPGCLARVERAKERPDRVGSILRVVQPCRGGSHKEGTVLLVWGETVRIRRDMYVWECEYPSGVRVLAADDCLMPITPPPGTSLELADIDLDMYAAHQRGELV